MTVGGVGMTGWGVGMVVWGLETLLRQSVLFPLEAIYYCQLAPAVEQEILGGLV